MEEQFGECSPTLTLDARRKPARRTPASRRALVSNRHCFSSYAGCAPALLAVPSGAAGKVTLRDVPDVITVQAHHQVDEAPKLVTIGISDQPGNCCMFWEEPTFWSSHASDAMLAGPRREQRPMPNAKTQVRSHPLRLHACAFVTHAFMCAFMCVCGCTLLAAWFSLPCLGLGCRLSSRRLPR